MAEQADAAQKAAEQAMSNISADGQQSKEEYAALELAKVKYSTDFGSTIPKYLAPIRTVNQEPPVVKVFVRLGDSDGERTIAFRIPNGMDPMDLLERGATIDGNQAVLPVTWEPEGGYHSDGAYTCPDLNKAGTASIYSEFSGKSMSRVLGDCQRGLVQFFKERGFRVQFA